MNHHRPDRQAVATFSNPAKPRPIPHATVAAKLKTVSVILVALFSTPNASNAQPPSPSLSIGEPTSGLLTNAQRMPSSGQGWRTTLHSEERGTVWGTNELIRTLQKSARTVAERHRGSTLLVGNISYQHGGNFTWSVSHTNGRDADLAFYLRDASGNDCKPTNLVNLSYLGNDPDSDCSLDVPRTWALIETLLLDEDARVQFIFVNYRFRRRLLSWAADNGRPIEAIDRAKRVVRHPKGSGPHRDHLHVRLYCTKQDLYAGCRDRGTVWPWLQNFEPELEQKRLYALALLSSHSPTEQATALRTLAILGKTEDEERLRRAVYDPNPLLSSLALQAWLSLPKLDSHALYRMLSRTNVPQQTRAQAAIIAGLSGQHRYLSILRRIRTTGESLLVESAELALSYLLGIATTDPERPRRRWSKDNWQSRLTIALRRAAILGPKQSLGNRAALPTIVQCAQGSDPTGHTCRLALHYLTGKHRPRMGPIRIPYGGEYWSGWWHDSHKRLGYGVEVSNDSR